MDIKDIQILATAQVATNSTKKHYLDKVRKNLMTLMCQTDIVEMTGDVEAFGGDKDVGANISKAIFSLFCIGATLGVDIAKSMENVTANVKKVLTPPANHSGNNPDIEDAPPAETGAAEGDKPADITSGTAVKETPPQGSLESKDEVKTRKIQNYKNSIANAKTKAEFETIWKNIQRDNLDGKEKYALQQEMSGAKKRLAA